MFVGSNSHLISCGLESDDGLRCYRSTSFKPGEGIYQANLERYCYDKKKKRNVANGHIAITDYSRHKKSSDAAGIYHLSKMETWKNKAAAAEAAGLAKTASLWKLAAERVKEADVYRISPIGNYSMDFIINSLQRSAYCLSNAAEWLDKAHKPKLIGEEYIANLWEAGAEQSKIAAESFYQLTRNTQDTFTPYDTAVAINAAKKAAKFEADAIEAIRVYALWKRLGWD